MTATTEETVSEKTMESITVTLVARLMDRGWLGEVMAEMSPAEQAQLNAFLAKVCE
ncbi:MAG: hypothetical protein ABR585_07470 [Gemmatimonadaceae bacterium]